MIPPTSEVFKTSEVAIPVQLSPLHPCTEYMKLSRLSKFVFGASLWGMAVLIFAVLLEPTPENFTLAVSIILSGVYTLLLYLTRFLWLKGFSKSPFLNAVLLGSFNAAFIETLFFIVEKAFGASGVAAHPNLLIDLLLTMPWYIGMVWIFARVQKTEQFSPAAVLLLGAVYELGADGIVGGLIIPAFVGEPVGLLQFLAFSVLAAFWQFIPVYSSLVLPPAWILEKDQREIFAEKPHLLRGFLPLIWLFPFTIYLVLFMLAINYFAG